MGWFKDWLYGPQDFDKPVAADDNEEITVLVKLRYRDDTTKETERRVARNGIADLVDDLMSYDDVREAWVYEEVSYHHKGYDDSLAMVGLGTALGASMSSVR